MLQHLMSLPLIVVIIIQLGGAVSPYSHAADVAKHAESNNISKLLSVRCAVGNTLYPVKPL